MTKLALLSGITGMDGSHLAELLLSKNYIVYGTIRRHSIDFMPRIDHIKDKLRLLYADLTDASSLHNVFNTIFKEQKEFSILEVYNLAAQSNVKVSFDIPVYTGMVDALGTLHMLEAIRLSGIQDKIRLYQSSTSELFGRVVETPQTEKTPFNPVSPYGVSKMYGFYIVKNYRESYNMFVCNGILFNHTSPRRGENFVCRKITMAVAAISQGKQDCLYLGNLNSFRDIGSSKSFVEGMWLMLQQKEPIDYVLSTGETFSVRELVQMAFNVVDMKIEWEPERTNEVGKFGDKIVVKIKEEFFRPSEVDLLLGDSSKARKELNWSPRYTTREIFTEMVLHDLQRLK
jgi:GDPmannose 4,6-dehydratase